MTIPPGSEGAPSEPTSEIHKSRLERALESFPSNMGLEDYLEFADITLEDLKGKVLDIGSGQLERFSREAAEKGIEVVSLNPQLLNTIERADAITGAHLDMDFFQWQSSLPWQEKSVAGLAQELPFQDESFETIVSSAAIPGYIHPEDYLSSIREISRVLKPGGKAYLFPLFEIPDEPDVLYRDKLFEEALKQSGENYEFKKIDNENFTVPYRVVMIEKPAKTGGETK